MSKQIIPFNNFVDAVGSEHTEFVNNLHSFLTEHDCIVNIKEAKSGYVVSYIYTPTKQTIANYVFRKKGPMLRIYADKLPSYMGILDGWPDIMKETIRKAGPCKRLLNPAACNPRCPMGFDFVLEGERQQKCRNSAFMFFLIEDTKPYLREMVEQELFARKLFMVVDY